MRVDGGAHDLLPGLQLSEEAQQCTHIEAVGKALTAHQATRFEGGVREQESVGGDEIDARMVGPARQQCLQDPRDRALADRDTAREADHERDARMQLAEERPGDGVQFALRRVAEVQQARQRQVHLFDFGQRDRLVGASQRFEIGFGQREGRRGPQTTPLVAGEVDVRGDDGFVFRLVRGFHSAEDASSSGPALLGKRSRMAGWVSSRAEGTVVP